MLYKVNSSGTLLKEVRLFSVPCSPSLKILHLIFLQFLFGSYRYNLWQMKLWDTLVKLQPLIHLKLNLNGCSLLTLGRAFSCNWTCHTFLILLYTRSDILLYKQLFFSCIVIFKGFINNKYTCSVSNALLLIPYFYDLVMYILVDIQKCVLWVWIHFRNLAFYFTNADKL